MTDRPISRGDHPEAARYEIRLAGHLDARWAPWFDGLTVAHGDDGTTRISGPIADQAALHGLLLRVRDLGLPLVSITQDEADRMTTQSAATPTTTGRQHMNTNDTRAVVTQAPGMSTDRKAAIWIGVLYIIGTVGLVLSVLVTGGLLDGPDYLAQVAAEPNRLALGTLFLLLPGLALAMVPVVFWPIGKRYNETLAMGYIVFRGALETIMYIALAVGWLQLIALSTQPDAGALAGFVRTTEKVIWDQLTAIPFALGALMFSVLLYQSRLVPRWLSVWGLVGAVLYLVPPLGSMLGLSLGVLMGPLAVQEMVLAGWLIAKGFSPTALAAASTTGTPTWRAAARTTAPAS